MAEKELTPSDLLGKMILVGFTYYTHDNVFVEQKQFFGTVIAVHQNCIVIRKADGSTFTIPPDLRSTRIAPPGEYRLRSTGEIVLDPDYLSTWIVNLPEPKAE